MKYKVGSYYKLRDNIHERPDLWNSRGLMDPMLSHKAFKCIGLQYSEYPIFKEMPGPRGEDSGWCWGNSLVETPKSNIALSYLKD